MEKLPLVRFVPNLRFDIPQRPTIERPLIVDRKREIRSDYIEVKSTHSHPLAHLAGAFDNEPLWEEFLQAMREYRREIDEQEDFTE